MCKLNLPNNFSLFSKSLLIALFYMFVGCSSEDEEDLQAEMPELKIEASIYSDKIESVNFGYKENNPPMKWKLINEEKEILSQKCFKAITSFRGRNFIAWYTKDIPINDGPYKFSGLPGLILEVYDDNENFHYKPLAIINKNQEILYDKDIKFIERIKMVEARINLIKKHIKGDIKVNPLEKK